ncbi:MAG: hypothetical protein ACOYJ8_03705 [Patescibacteria group bacterium]|jgi:hypothetical protein
MKSKLKTFLPIVFILLGIILVGLLFLYNDKKKNNHVIEPEEQASDSNEPTISPTTAPTTQEITTETAISNREEVNKLLSGDIQTEESQLPSDLEKALFEKLKYFCDSEEKEFWNEDIVETETVDLNEDGFEEFIVKPFKVCGEMFSGASGNGPFYIYENRGDSWNLIGELEGNYFVISDNQTNGYYDININYHTSVDSGTITTYQWSQQTPESEFFYNSIVKRSYNFRED